MRSLIFTLFFVLAVVAVKGQHTTVKDTLVAERVLISEMPMDTGKTRYLIDVMRMGFFASCSPIVVDNPQNVSFLTPAVAELGAHFEFPLGRGMPIALTLDPALRLTSYEVLVYQGHGLGYSKYEPCHDLTAIVPIGLQVLSKVNHGVLVSFSVVPHIRRVSGYTGQQIKGGASVRGSVGYAFPWYTGSFRTELIFNQNKSFEFYSTTQPVSFVGIKLSYVFGK